MRRRGRVLRHLAVVSAGAALVVACAADGGGDAIDVGESTPAKADAGGDGGGNSTTLGDSGGAAKPDAGTGTVVESGLDAGADSTSDAGTEAGIDSGADAGPDAGTDGGPDADADTDAGLDAASDAGNAGDGGDSGADADTDSGADSGADAGASCTSNCPIAARYKTPTSGSTKDIRPHLDIYNNGTTAQPLTEITVRYWFTSETSNNLTYNCDYAAMGCDKTLVTFGSVVGPATADHYLQMAFTSGTIAAGGHTGEIQARFHDTAYAVTFTQTNDYSFDASKTAYTEWTHITVYRNGALIYGVEP